MLTTNTSQFALGRDAALFNLLKQIETERSEIKKRIDNAHPDAELSSASYWQGQDVALALVEMRVKAFCKEIERFTKNEK